MARLSNDQINDAFSDGKYLKNRKKKIKTVRVKDSKGPLVKYTENGNRVKIWLPNLDDKVWHQAQDFADLSFVHPKGLSLMPDVHYGFGVPVGSVLPTLGALVPSAVGVDIGCGMLAVRLDIHANQLPDNLSRVRRLIERRVPLNSGSRHKEISSLMQDEWQHLEKGHEWIKENQPRAFRPKAIEQLGTLGAGNHFIEICLDESKQVWIMLHSGSRGAGANIGNFFIQKARERCIENGEFINNLGWLNEEDPLFDDYVTSVEWAQNYASINRKVMLQLTLDGLSEAMNRKVNMTQKAVSCHHNYIAREKHFNEDVWITRKGAISAQKGELGIIPSAMGQESFIVEGLGETDSWCSCSHGAGRVMSRSSAKGRYTAKDLRHQTQGVECRKDKSIVDEIPSAYKPIRAVMKNQRDLTKVKHTLKAIVCIKGI